MKNWLRLEPAAVGAAAAALYTLIAMVWRAVDGQEVLEPDIIATAIAAIWAVVTRGLVTPLARPRDKRGRALRP